MDYVTIATKANAVDYGDMGHGSDNQGQINSPIRGITATNSNSYKQMEFMTIPTTGNSTDFGNLSYGRENGSVFLAQYPNTFDLVENHILFPHNEVIKINEKKT